MFKKTCTILALCLPPLWAQAHYLWIESPTADEARVYFGEFNEGVREKAGGRLDERDAREGWLIKPDGTREALSFTKKEDHFAVHPPAKNGWLLVQDLTNEVKDWTSSDIGIVKPMFYARAAVAGKLEAAEPTLALDLIPDAKDAHVLRVFFQKKPLAKAKVMVHAPNQWSQELQANDAGEVTIATPWPGRYVIEVIHKEREEGTFAGQAYEAVRHRVTFSHVY